MDMATFLTRYAHGKYVTMADLARWARTDLRLRTRAEFAAALESYFRSHRDGRMENGFVFYTELPITGKPFTVRCGQKNVAILTVGRPM